MTTIKSGELTPGYPVHSHFFPQTWFSDFSIPHRILKYQRDKNFYESLLDVYRDHGVDKEGLESINKTLNERTTDH